MKYSRDCPNLVEAVEVTRAHVVAHMSSVASINDDEEEYADQVEVEISALGNGDIRITGYLDKEPRAPYLGNAPFPRGLVIGGSELAKRIQAKLTHYGVPWRILPGADRRGNGQVWGDVAGGIMHHTATRTGPTPRVLIDGRSDLSGPLCNTAGEGDGVVAFVAYWPANHAGASGGRGTAPLPVTRTFNKRVWGHEIVYPGVSPMTDAQYRSAVILGRAIAEVLGTDAERIRAHAETSVTGKWDPGYAPGKTIDMGRYRREIGGAKPTPTKKKGENMIENFRLSGKGKLRIIAPTGSASSITARAWLSVVADAEHGGWVHFWAQNDDSGIADQALSVAFKDGRSERKYWELPSGTTQVNIEYDFKGGAGCVALETESK